MNPAKLEWHDFPANGITWEHHGEFVDGWYLAETNSGDFVAFHLNNQFEHTSWANGGLQNRVWVEIKDQMNDDVDTVSFKQFALIKED